MILRCIFATVCVWLRPGRLDIRPFSADELVPAMQTFDAVSQGIVEAGHDFPGYWKEKNEAFVAYASVPFGLDAEGYNIWLYEKGGLEMMQELYGRFNLYALPGGQVGQEMGLFSNKRATKMEDLPECAYAPLAGTWRFFTPWARLSVLARRSGVSGSGTQYD